jgi:hypothetical protein
MVRQRRLREMATSLSSSWTHHAHLLRPSCITRSPLLSSFSGGLIEGGWQCRLQPLICTGRLHLGEGFRQLQHRTRRIVARTGEPSGGISSSAPKRSRSSRSSRTPMRERQGAGHLVDGRGAGLGWRGSASLGGNAGTGTPQCVKASGERKAQSLLAYLWEIWVVDSSWHRVEPSRRGGHRAGCPAGRHTRRDRSRPSSQATGNAARPAGR